MARFVLRDMSTLENTSGEYQVLRKFSMCNNPFLIPIVGYFFIFIVTLSCLNRSSVP